MFSSQLESNSYC